VVELLALRAGVVQSRVPDRAEPAACAVSTSRRRPKSARWGISPNSASGTRPVRKRWVNGSRMASQARAEEALRSAPDYFAGLVASSFAARTLIFRSSFWWA
jgi:hypothetical protein